MMIVDKATIERNANRVLERVSPSQVEAFELCPRRWYNGTIRGLREATSDPQQRGTDVGALVDRYYKTGGKVLPEEPYEREDKRQPPITDVEHARAAELAWPVIEILGEPSEYMTSEEWVELDLGEGLPKLRGRYDHFDLRRLPRAENTTKPGKLHNVSLLSDTKCRSSFRYAKSADPTSGDEKYIGADLQLNMYASALVEALGLDAIAIQHNYSLTDKRKKPQGLAVTKVLTREELEPRRLKTVETVREMTRWAKERPLNADPLPANTLACSKFPPKGCPYKGLCGMEGSGASWARGPESNEGKGETKMAEREGESLMERMKRQQAEMLSGGSAGGGESVEPEKTEQKTEAAPKKEEKPKKEKAAEPDKATDPVSEARERLRSGAIRYEASSKQIYEKSGPTAWVVRVPTMAESIAIEELAKGNKPEQPKVDTPTDIRPTDAPEPTNPKSEAAPEQKKEVETKKERKSRAAKEETVVSSGSAGDVKVDEKKDDAPPAPTKAPAGVTVYVDCVPTRGAHAGSAVDYNEWLAPLFEAASRELGLADWRLDYANKSEGTLAVLIRAALAKLPPAIVVTGHSKARAVFLECVAPHAAAVIKGV